MNRLARRRAVDLAAKSVSTVFALIAILMLAWILWTLVDRGLPALGGHALTASGSDGLLNAVVGSLILVVLALVIGTPIGILAGTYLAEMGRGTRFGGTVRFVNDILLSAPSILIGLFVYQLLVVPFGGFSGWAGAVALAIIIIPVVVRATEDMLNLVPVSLREAAFALGSPQWKVITFVSWRAARAGIATGVLLALARAAGETAPLLFTSLGNNALTANLNGPMASLPVAIYTDAQDPSNDLVALAWGGALLITAGVLVLNILTRFVLTPRQG